MSNTVQNDIPDPSLGRGILPPLSFLESGFNWIMSKLLIISAIALVAICFCITIDTLGRVFFNKPWDGITDLEPLFMSVVGFTAMAYAIVNRGAIRIELLTEKFPPAVRRSLFLFANLECCIASLVIGWAGLRITPDWSQATSVLNFPEWPILGTVSVCIVLVGIAFIFQIIHCLRSMSAEKEWIGIVLAVAFAAFFTWFAFLYKASGLNLSGLAVGAIIFLILFSTILLGVPLGFAMAAMGLIGLLMVARWPSAAINTVASIPFTRTANFMLIALPMFMLMGDMISISDLSKDLFNFARKWLGFMPGGLACATVGGCAGFGAICGDSLATALTFTKVAYPAMEEDHYDGALAAAALSAGGTLGILIPPSMGFIIYSMITEVSVGKLFAAGILPGLLLTSMFIAMIFFQVLRKPSLAPNRNHYTMKEKLASCVQIIPVLILFLVVVIGILQGVFTPAEGGALGAVMAFFYSLARRKLTVQNTITLMKNCTLMFGQMFTLFLGLYTFGAFLGFSRLPNLMADFIGGLAINRYVILTVVIIFYIFLGCVMNIMPMMMLTLPSIYPTIEALGFDGVWFGVICVIVMEMGMITPPVGMNVLTISTILGDVPTTNIFKEVIPFCLMMLLCILLIILFPQIALVLT